MSFVMLGLTGPALRQHAFEVAAKNALDLGVGVFSAYKTFGQI
jgi:hypothetical protein